MVSFIRVMSLATRTSWQERQPFETAVWTDFALNLPWWQLRHFALSVSLSRGMGCLAAKRSAVPQAASKTAIDTIADHGEPQKGKNHPKRITNLLIQSTYLKYPFPVPLRGSISL